MIRRYAVSIRFFEARFHTLTLYELLVFWSRLDVSSENFVDMWLNKRFRSGYIYMHILNCFMEKF